MRVRFRGGDLAPDLVTEDRGGRQLLVAGATLEAPLVVPPASCREPLSIVHRLLALGTQLLLQHLHPALQCSVQALQQSVVLGGSNQESE